MASVPVKKLLISMGIPVILSMMLQAAYNIVDSAFVSNMKENGEAALTALGYAFPAQMLMVAIGVGTGVGVNALLSKSLGQGDPQKASRAAGNGIFLGIVIYLVFVLFGIFGVPFYVGTQTKNPEIYEMTVSYLRICSTVSFGIVGFSVFEKILQAVGRSACSTVAQISGALVNIILDPILIYGWLFFPEMGVVGAAIATVVGQIVSFVVALLFHLVKDKELDKSVRHIRPSWKLIRTIYAIGLPAIIAQALMSVMTYGMNVILNQIGEAVVTAYSLYYKIQQFILFAAFGLRDAITPIISFNHGMRSKQRVNEGIRYGLIYTLAIMAVGLVLLEILAKPFSAVFGLSGTTQEYCIGAIRFVSLSFLFAGANVAFQGIFQALNGGFESLIISVCRQALFVLPVAWGFAQLAKKNIDLLWLVWMTFLIAEFLSMLIAIVFMKRIHKKTIAVLE